MTKYSEKMKLAAVSAYFSGSQGMRAVAEAHGVGFHSLRFWVSLYQLHGVDGLKSKSRTLYDVDFKLRVLTRVREEGLSYRQAGAIFGVHRFDQIGVWERAYVAKGLAGLNRNPTSTRQEMKSKKPDRRSTAAEAGEEREPSRDDLLRELQRLRMENAYLKKLQALLSRHA